MKHVKSNAITVAKDGRLLGMGSGQPNRVKSVEIAMEKAGDDVQGRRPRQRCLLPLRLGRLDREGLPGGRRRHHPSRRQLRDQDGIDCCNQYGVTMVLTGTRHFRH